MAKFDFRFLSLENKMASKPFLLQPFGDNWESWTYSEVGDKARRLAAFLRSLGLKENAHIGLVSKNCREWIVADIAIIMAGYVSVPFFPTLGGEQIKEVLELGDVDVLFVGKIDNWDDMKTGIRNDIPTISFPNYKGCSKVEATYDWNTILNTTEPIQEVMENHMDDIWTIIFTSGTTGTPKGVVLDFQILEDAAIPTETNNPLNVDLKGNNRFFSYLPLNHIAERLVVESSAFRYGGSIAFAESLETFAKNLADAKPTTFFGVPRIYTKFKQAILTKMPQQKLDKLMKIPFVSGIIKKKLKTALGLQEATSVVSGAAPLPESLKVWWAKVGVNIMNGYGMTENCAICTLLPADTFKAGSVGKPQTGVKLKIDDQTGEIMMSGPYVMKRYYKNPEKTAQVIEDGWLRTGDQGYIDDDGCLFISGRVKDTFKTTKGEYIIPGPIENQLSSNNDIEQICIVGLGCVQPIALINLSESGSAKDKNDLKSSLESSRINLNKTLKNYEKISTIVVLKEIWTPENGLLTPTLKVKRNVITNKFQNQLGAWEELADSIIID